MSLKQQFEPVESRAAELYRWEAYQVDKLELIQKIGNDVCEDCGKYRDCGLEYDNCDRISSALGCLSAFLKEIASQQAVEADAESRCKKCDCSLLAYWNNCPLCGQSRTA